MKYYVYYSDDPKGSGFESFPDDKAARQFIEGRLANDPSRRLDMYTLIEGKQLFIKMTTGISIVDFSSEVRRENLS